jgi:hypothetical protein
MGANFIVVWWSRWSIELGLATVRNRRVIPTIRALGDRSSGSLTLLDGWAKTGAEFSVLTLPIDPPHSTDMFLRTALKVLLATALGLPVAECVLVGVRSLVASMGDSTGAELLATLASVCLAFWGVSVAGLAIVASLVLVVESEGDTTRR